MAYSRRTSTEESKHKKRAYSYIVLTIIALVLLFFLGIPLIVKYAGLLTGLRESGEPVETNDTTPPAPPRFDDLPEATNEFTVDISGNAEPGATLILFLNRDTEELVVGSDGQFTHNFPLDKGENRVSAQTRDSAGNESVETDVLKIIYDNEPPDLSISSPENGAEYFGSNQRQAVIEGITEQDTEVKINGRVVVVDNDGGFTYATTLSDGENQFAFVARDTAGNETESSLTLSFTP
jgi:hypothetical protein